MTYREQISMIVYGRLWGRCCGPCSLAMPHKQTWFGGRERLWLDRGRVSGPAAALAGLAGPAQQTAERRHRAEADALIEQDGPTSAGAT